MTNNPNGEMTYLRAAFVFNINLGRVSARHCVFMKKLLLPVWLCFLFAQMLDAQAPVAKNYEFRNGQWYNGKDFTPATWYVSKGVFSKKAPSKIDSVIDLQNRWVVPPMGDAYCMSVAGNSIADKQLSWYMGEGIFYLNILGNTKEARTALQGMVNTPQSPDAVFANGAMTCTLGYPFTFVEGPAHNIRNPQKMAERYSFLKQQRKMLGDGYWFLDNKDAVERNWAAIKAQNPGVVFIVLHDATNMGGKENKGLTEDVAKAVIKKAHKSDLRVFAHVENADDVRMAIKLGVDGIANLPGAEWDGAGDTKAFELTDDDLKKLAKKKTAVVPLYGHAQALGPRPAVQEYHAKTLKRLLAAGVQIAIGSDDPMRTTRAEVSYLFGLPDMDYAAVVKTLCETTPRAIFPNRKIGKIEDGYEASFLVLDDNPTNNLLKIRAISLKVKNGTLIK